MARGSPCNSRHALLKKLPPLTLQFKSNRWHTCGVKRKAKAAAPPPAIAQLKGWQQIAHFLGQPISVAQRWAKSSMPVKHDGKFVTALPDELNGWLGREAGGEPVHVATEGADLAAELKRGLSFVRRKKL